ncbi:MAG: sulfite exporter TauE/SafE family protein [Magnetococcus sp. YQC-3]
MTSFPVDLWLTFLTALLGSGHCIGMCGGIAVSCSLGIHPDSRRGAARFYLPLLYSLGRVGTYVLLGALTGWIGSLVLFHARPSGLNGLPHLLVGVFMILMGLRSMGLFAGGGADGVWFSRWSRLLTSAHPVWRALGMGVLTGLLPCHLHWAFQAEAFASGSLWGGVGILFAFGLGTLPALWGFAVIASWLDGQARYRLTQLAGLLLIVLGISSVRRAFLVWAV